MQLKYCLPPGLQLNAINKIRIILWGQEYSVELNPQLELVESFATKKNYGAEQTRNSSSTTAKAH
jgi:hypothetical protein